MAGRGEVRIQFMPDVDRTVRALRILERLATDLGDALRDAATDLELLAPDDEDLAPEIPRRISTDARPRTARHAEAICGIPRATSSSSASTSATRETTAAGPDGPEPGR